MSRKCPQVSMCNIYGPSTPPFPPSLLSHTIPSPKAVYTNIIMCNCRYSWTDFQNLWVTHVVSSSQQSPGPASPTAWQTSCLQVAPWSRWYHTALPGWMQTYQMVPTQMEINLTNSTYAIQERREYWTCVESVLNVSWKSWLGTLIFLV